MSNSQRTRAILTLTLVGAALAGCGGLGPDAAVLQRQFPKAAAGILQGPEGFRPAPQGFTPKLRELLPALEAAHASLSAHGGLFLQLPADPEAPLRFQLASGPVIRVEELGLTGAGRLAGAAVSYPRRDGAVFWQATSGGYEEWLLVQSPPSGLLAQWRLRGGQARQAGRGVEILDARGHVELRVFAPQALRADGRVLPVSLRAQGEAIQLSTPGAAGWVLVDPVWQSTTALTVARQDQTATLLSNGLVLVAGGAGSTGAVTDCELFDPTTDAWAVTGALATGRSQHSAVLLKTGKVLVAGGTNGTTALSSAELYDPAAGTWSSAGTLVSARYAATSTLLQDGTVLLAGGIGTAGTALSAAELYDPSLGTWAATGALNTARSSHTAVLLGNGEVLAAAGNQNGTALQSAELYSTTGKTWSVTGALATARWAHSATLLANGNVLVVGGGPTATSYLASAELFNGTTWSAAGALTTARRLQAAALLPNGHVVVAGGTGSAGQLATTEDYNPGTNSWSAAGKLATARTSFTLTILPKAKLLAAGGYGSTYLASSELYDPMAGGWSAAASMLTARYDNTSTLLPNGKVLVAGGNNGSMMTECELYDPVANTWAITGSLATARSLAQAIVLPTGKVLVAGGYDGTNSISTCELYDPTAGSWSPTGNLVTSRQDMSPLAILSTGKVLVAGGGNTVTGTTTAISSAELYDPAVGSWAATAPMSIPRRWPGGILLRTGKFLMVGGDNAGTDLSTAELYDPTTSTWGATGSISFVDNDMTLALLGSGKVLLAGGSALTTTTMLYNPSAGTWSATGSMAAARNAAHLVVLPNGKAILEGGWSGSTYLTTGEVYDPDTGTWGAGGTTNGRYGYSSLLLPNGKAAFIGGYNPSIIPNVDLYDEGLGALSGSTPSLNTGMPESAPGAPVPISGTLFTGVSAASSGNSRASSEDYPLVALDAPNGTRLYGSVTNWTASAATATLPTAIEPGWYWMHVIVAGAQSLGEPILVGDPAKLAITTPARTFNAGTCPGSTNVITVQLEDEVGNALNAAVGGQAITASSSSTGTVTWYTDSACSTVATGGAFTVPAGASTVNLYYSDTQVGTPTVTISGTGMTSATQLETVVAGTPSKLAFTTGPFTYTAGICGGTARGIVVQLEDGSGNPVNAGVGGQAFTAGSTSGTGLLYAASTCGTSTTNFTIPAGSSTVTLYYSDTTAGSPSISLSNASSLANPTPQVETVVAGAASQLAFSTAAQTVPAGSCSGVVTVQTKDSYGNVANVSSATAVTLSGSPSSGLTFYAGSGCTGSAVTSISIGSGTSSASFSFKDTAAGSVVLTASSSLSSPTQTETISPLAPNQLVFATVAQTVPAGSCSGVATVQAEDTYGNVSNVSAATAVTLSGSPSTGLTFYAGSGCTGSAVTSVSITSGTSSASFSFKDTAAGSVILTASSSLGSPTQTETISPLAPSQLVFATVAQTVPAGSCSGVATVQAEDTYGNVSNVSAATAVTLSGSPSTGLTFYAGSGCTGSAVTSISIASGTSSASYSFKDTTAGSVVLTASSSLGSPTQTETISPLAPSQLAFATVAQTVPAGSCSGVATVQAEDTYGNVSNASAATAVTLSGSPSTGLTFYAGAGCAGSAVTSISIASGTSSASFSFKGTAAGSVVLTASSSLSSPTQTETITPLAPSRLVFSTAAQTVAAGSCSGIATLQAEDSLGNASNVSAATAVTLSGSPSTGLTFYAGAGCAGSAVTSISIASGTSSASFSFKDTTAGSVVLTASSSLGSPTQTETISPLAPSQLAFATVAQTVPAGSCSGIATVQAEDSLGNASNVSAATAVTLSGSPSTGLTFYAGAGCAGSAVTSISIASGTSSASFSFKDTTAASVVLTASSSLTSPTQTETITPLAPSQLVFTTTAQTVAAGSCSGIATVQAEDTYGNVSNVSAATAVTLSGSPSTGLTFYAGSGCTGAAVTSITIASGTSSASFSFKDTAAGSVIITASSSLTSPTQTETITAGAPQSLSLSGIANPVRSGATSAVTVAVKDSLGNLATSYRGTVHFASTDAAATLPPDYTFTAADNGQHSFTPGVTLATLGSQTVTATDTVTSGLTGSQTVMVNLAPPAIVHDAILTAGVGYPYPYNVQGRINTTGGPVTTYGVCGVPAGFAVDAASGVVTWTPTAAGTVSVCVNATNSAGSDSYTLSVVVSRPVGNSPTASFTMAPSTGAAPLTVAFDGSASTADPSTTLVAYRWNFGTGAPLAYGATQSNTYPLAGGYQPSLEVVDGYGRTATVSHSLAVNTSSGLVPPTAQIVASALSGIGTLTVNFSCTCTPGSAPIVSWTWDDGSQLQSGPAASFTFGPGAYNVTLTVLDANGLTATDSVQVVVSTSQNLRPPSCALDVQPPAATVPFNVTFSTDVQPGDGTITTRTLTLYDGSTSSATSVTRQLTSAGHYPATLSVTDSNNLTCTANVVVKAIATSGELAPRILSVPPTRERCGVPDTYRPAASGAQPLSWSLVPDSSGKPPPGFAIDAQSGTVSINPTAQLSSPMVAQLAVKNAAGQDVQQLQLTLDCAQNTSPLAVGCTCNSTGWEAGLWFLPLLYGLLRRRIRRPDRRRSGVS